MKCVVPICSHLNMSMTFMFDLYDSNVGATKAVMRLIGINVVCVVSYIVHACTMALTFNFIYDIDIATAVGTANDIDMGSALFLFMWSS